MRGCIHCLIEDLCFRRRDLSDFVAFVAPILNAQADVLEAVVRLYPGVLEVSVCTLSLHRNQTPVLVEVGVIFGERSILLAGHLPPGMKGRQWVLSARATLYTLGFRGIDSTFPKLSFSARTRRRLYCRGIAYHINHGILNHDLTRRRP